MNSNTRTDLQEFIKAVQEMARCVPPAEGVYFACMDLKEKGDQLIRQLDKDETII